MDPVAIAAFRMTPSSRPRRHCLTVQQGPDIRAAAICSPIVFTLLKRYMVAGQSARTRRSKDFVKTLRLSAALAALTLTASTTCAAVIDTSNALGPSGGYTSQAYYQDMLGGQPMTAAQQAYSNQEDQLRQLGFLSEFGGDFALGQMFYHIAYGISPPPPPSGASDASDPGYTGSAATDVLTDAGYTGSDVTDAFITEGDGGAGLTLTAIAVPEASTWAMMLLGFAGLGFAGYRPARKTEEVRLRS